MPKLEAVEAALAGFRLIRRNPVSPAIWGLLTFVLTVAPLLVALPNLVAFMSELIAQAEAGGEPDMDQMMAMQFQWMAISPLLSLTALVARALVTGATFRAVLSPNESRWAFLRVSLGEVMIVVMGIVLGIIVVMAALVGGAAVGILAGLASNVSAGAAVAAGLLAGLALVVGLIWLLLRLSLAIPASFATRSFALGEGWRISKGSALRLLLMVILMFVFVMLIETVIGGVVGLALIGGLLGSGLDEAAIEAFMAQPPETIVGVLTPWVIGIGLIGSLVGGYLLAIATAPWADAYRQLSSAGPGPASEPAEAALAA